MKKISNVIVIICLLASFSANAQLKVLSDGSVQIKSYTPDFGSGIRTTVYNPDACAYHLAYNGQDRFFVHASGYLWCEKGGYFGSDIKFKSNIKDIESPLQKIVKLRGIEYTYKKDSLVDLKGNVTYTTVDDGPIRLGLIAQDVEKVIPGIVKSMPNSSKAVAYTDLIALIIEAMKEQQTQIETLQIIVYSQEQEVIKLKKDIESCCSNDNSKLNSKRSSKSDETTSINETLSENAKLFDNVPNPFSLNTEIKFVIPENSTSAKLIIHDMQGIELKSFVITQKGFESITISGSELKAGMYLYTLLIDNKIIDTKRMILTKK